MKEYALLASGQEVMLPITMTWGLTKLPLRQSVLYLPAFGCVMNIPPIVAIP
jgi:hypothetical protein